MMFPRPTNRGKNACAEWHEPVRITAFESKSRFLNVMLEKPNGHCSEIVC